VIDAARLSLLEAMGIDVYALRARAAAPASAPAQRTQPRVAVVCARGIRADARLARVFKHLPQTLGVAPAAIEWLEADADGKLAVATEAIAYLVFGAAMARALGVQLSTMQQNTAAIAVTADPALLPGTAADKRALWQVLKPLARRLGGTAG
jgi:hypothetical protein